ncbi:MAG: hypothetical protein ACKPE6_03050, partial [Gammaproteobacteria bacterium]
QNNSLLVSSNNADAVAISGQSSASVTVSGNTISGVDGGIVAFNAFGNLTISNNTISSYNDNGIRILSYSGTLDRTVSLSGNSVTGANQLLVDTNSKLKYQIGTSSAAALTTSAQLHGILADNSGIAQLTAEQYLSFAPQTFTVDGLTVTAAYIGDDSPNTLVGNAGANLLQGNGGNDTLSGGAGRDTFVFSTALDAQSNVDLIRDWGAGGTSDLIRLDNDVFSALGAPGALSAAAFTTGKTAGTAEHRIVYDRPTGELYYDPDGSGPAAQQHFATIGTTTHPALTAAVFLIVD